MPEAPTLSYQPAPDRYAAMTYRFCGRSGLQLPLLSLGLWHNFGDTTPIEQRSARWSAPPSTWASPTSTWPTTTARPTARAETNFGRILREDLAAHRDELIISSKAGWDMWPGPYGQGGGSRKYVLASLDQSLRAWASTTSTSSTPTASTPTRRSRRRWARWPRRVRQGKALYVGISSYSAAQDARGGRASCAAEGVPLLIHQPSYNLLNRWVEPDLLDALEEVGAGMIAFTALAQGLLTDKYLDGIPADARINRPGGGSFEQRDAVRGEPGPGPRRSTRSPGGAARRWPRWPTRGCCATRA